MRNIKIKILCFTCCFIASMGAFADVTINGNKYSLNISNRTAALSGTTLSNVVIPETITYDGVTYNVTSIKENAFYYNHTLNTVKLSSSVKKIEQLAFNRCSLQQIDLKNVETIEEGAFCDCYHLNYIVLPKTVQQGKNIFRYINYGFNTNLKIICLREDLYTGASYTSYTEYPSSFYTIYQRTHIYDGKNSPEVTYIFNGIGAGFQPISELLDDMNITAGTHTGYLKCNFANGFMSFEVSIPYQYIIYPATLIARVKDTTKQYGEANPQFNSEYSGFVNYEDESVIMSHGSYSTSATAQSDIGTYRVEQSGAQAQNYTFTYESGTLTITKAPLTMTPRDKTMTYGDRIPNFDVDYQGLKNGETKPEWTNEPTISTTATSASNAGTYPITITGGVAKNYDVTFKSGTLTINKAILSATTKDATREYGDENPDFELTYSGLKNGDTAPEWTVAPTFATPATKTSPVGTYSITVTGGEAKNYTLQYYNTGKLSVTKAPLTATARSYTRKQGEDNPVFAVDYTGFKNGENKLALTQEPIATTTATKNSRPGTYPITVSGGVAMNYEFIYVNGTLTILPEGETEADTENFLTVNSITANKGSQVVMPIAMTNQKAITGLQFDLYLPAGVTIATKSNGKAMIETTDRMDGNYSITSEQMDGFVRILGYSADGDAFTGNSGDILKVTLNVGNTVNDGNYTIRLKDIVLSDVNNTEHHPADAGATLSVLSYTLGDVDNSGAININDVVCIINHILNRPVGTFIVEAADVDGNGTININDVVTLINRYILMRPAPALESLRAPRAAVTDDNYLHLATIDINPGETKEVELLMTNANAVAAAQGNIKLPAGLSFVTKANGKVDAKNINARSEDFTLSCAIQDDGSMTFAHYSADGFNYMGNNGGIFSFKIKADENAQSGSYNVNLMGVVLSVEGVGYDIPDRTSTLNITGSSGIAPIDNGELRIDNYYTLDGQKLDGTPTKKGVYIVNGHKVVVK